MQIYGPATSTWPPGDLRPAHGPRRPKLSGVESSAIQDEVNISDTARLVEQAKQAPDIRQDRVKSIRAQIASGTYETSGKLDVAVSRLLDEIG